MSNLRNLFRVGYQSYRKNSGHLVLPLGLVGGEVDEFERGWIQALKRSGELVSPPSKRYFTDTSPRYRSRLSKSPYAKIRG